MVAPVGEEAAGRHGFVAAAGWLLRDLVAGGAALGWVDPPSHEEISGLLIAVATAAARGDACLMAAWDGDELAGLGYWRRFARPTYRPHADLERVAVARARQGCGLGRALTTALVTAAVEARVEVLTLDLRGDNRAAYALYRSLGFVEYGRLADFVAVGERRYAKVLMALDLR